MKSLASFLRNRIQTKNPAATVLIATLVVHSVHAAQIIQLGDLPGGDTYSTAIDLSADGKTVLISSSDESGSRYARWTAASGFSLLPALDVQAFSPDGTVVVGATVTGALEAARWSEAFGLITMGAPATEVGIDPYSVAIDTSHDGSFSVGVGATLNSPFSEALLWDPIDGIVPLGFLPTDQPEPDFPSFSFANAISANGHVIVGASASTKHLDRGEQAFRWTRNDGMQALGFLPGALQSQAMAVSSNGAVIVGISGTDAFRWTAADGMQSIGSFLPLAVSTDGSVVVGRADLESGPAAYLWTPESGPMPLQAFLDQKGIPTAGLNLMEAVGVSDDGLAIAGTALNASGANEAFLVVLDPPAPSTSATVTFAGQANFLIIDPAGLRYGRTADGNIFTEIPGIAVDITTAATTVTWPNLTNGAYQFDLTGILTAPYTLSINFLHADGETSSNTFSATLGKGGSHKFTATIDAGSSAASVFARTYADSDGDKIVDAQDAYILSDLRPTVFIGSYNTGVTNIVLQNGASINDILSDFLRQSRNRTEFMGQLSKTSAEWEASGALTQPQKKKLISSALKAECPNWVSLTK